MIEAKVAASGIICYWSLSQDTDRQALAAGLEAAGFLKRLPDPRPAAACLKEALQESFGQRGGTVLVRPLGGKDGFDVVRETRGDGEYSRNSYRSVACVKLGQGDRLLWCGHNPYDGENCGRIGDTYRSLLGRLKAYQVSECLVGIVADLGGVKLRPTGGFYWLPAAARVEWAAAAGAVEGASVAGQHAVYGMTVTMDAAAVRAVKDAVVAEVHAEAQEMSKEVASGELGKRALQARLERASALRSKIAEYEGLLGEALDGLRAEVGAVEEEVGRAGILCSVAEGV